MKTISRYIMTLLLLITAATGAWASGEIVVTVTAADLQADKSTTFTKDGVTIKCWDRMQEGLAFSELYEMSTTLGYFTKIEITNQHPEGISGINGISGFTVNGSVATWTGRASSVGLGHYSVGPVAQFVFTIEPAGVDVTYNDAYTEASFKMPQYDVTATYTIKRDMTVDVTATIDDRIRIKKDGNDYQPVGKKGDIDASAALPTVTDNLDAENPVNMTEGNDYTLTLQKQGDTEDDWTDVTAYSVGNFRYKVTGTGNYSGIAYSNTFKLFEGYEVEVPAGEYITYYKDEALYVEDTEAKLYTITAVSGTTATADELTIAPANTPILVKNNGSETKTILLIPTSEEANNVTVYSGFTGTLEAATIAASTNSQDNYAFNGKEFVRVTEALDIAANKAWLEVPATASAAPQIRLIFSSATGIERVDGGQLTVDSWYSLDGRRLPGKPSQKGIYIVNGKKVVIK